MKRINLGFDGNSTDVVFSVREGKLYFYEKDRDIIHQKYGGKVYYTSRSGMSGNGFVCPKDKDNDIIVFGTYRVDIKGEEQYIKQVYSYQGIDERYPERFNTEKKPIFGYIPIRSHEGIDSSFPIVLTDGKKVLFTEVKELKTELFCWNEFQQREGVKNLKLEFFNSCGEKKIKEWSLRSNGFSRIDATRFLDLREERREAEELEIEETEGGLFPEKLGIKKIKGTEKWFHTKRGVIDHYWVENPRYLSGVEICNGWIGEGEGFFWKRTSKGVLAFMEIERKNLNKGKYVVKGYTSKWIEFEEFLEVLEFYSQDIQHFKEYFLRKVVEKARNDFVYASKIFKEGKEDRDATLKSMQENANIVLCIQDSLKTGNCFQGTENFIRDNNIHLDEDGYCKIGDILKNPNLEKMIANFNFRKVIALKLLPED